MATILHVDVDEDCRAIFRGALSHDGHTMVEAVDAEGVFERLASHDVQLIIGELYIRSPSGEVFLPALRTNPRAQQTRIIVVTTLAFDETRMAALAAGADAFLVKPCELHQLREAVHRCLGELYALPSHGRSDLGVQGVDNTTG